MFGKVDPYVVVKLGDQIKTSQHIKNTQNPEWNFHSKFDMVETTSQHVKVEVFDKDLGKDDLLGVADLSLVDIVNNPLVPPQWIPLQNCKSGEILLTAKLSMGQIQQEIRISNYMEELPSDSSSSDTEDEGEEDIKRLNNKLISYIDKVRLIQQSTESWKGISAQDDR